MKKVTLLFLMVFALCSLQACHGNKNNDDNADDSNQQVIDTAKKATIVIGKDDSKFVTDIDQACLAEIKIGALAKQRGTDKRIKNFGAMMVKDLTKGKGRLTQLAQIKKISLPDSISAKDEKSITELAGRTGKDFDRAYLDKTKADYKRAFNLFQNTAKYGYDPDIKGFAAKNLLTIQRHLDAIDAIDGSMK